MCDKKSIRYPCDILEEKPRSAIELLKEADRRKQKREEMRRLFRPEDDGEKK